MKNNPNLIFNTEILNRRADLRNLGNAKSYLNDKESINIVFLNEKPLLQSENDQLRICKLFYDHWLLNHVNLSVFLGIHKGKKIYAHNINQDDDEVIRKNYSLNLNKKIREDNLISNCQFSDLKSDLIRIEEKDISLAGIGKALLNWNLNNRYCSKCGLSLSFESYGWEARCVNCDNSYFPRVDPVVIILITNRDRTLLGRSYQFPKKLYSCLAGFVELGETIEMAAKREIKEEVGLKIYDIEYVTSQPWPFPSSLMIGLKAKTDEEFLTIDREELEHAVWVKKNELADLLSGNHNSMQLARTGTIARYLLESWLGE